MTFVPPATGTAAHVTSNRSTKQRPQPPPATVHGRLTLVGRALYGKSFRAKLANGLNISRSTLFGWMRGGGKRRDIDGELIDLIECERDAADQRSVELAALSKRFRGARP